MLVYCTLLAFSISGALLTSSRSCDSKQRLLVLDMLVVIAVAVSGLRYEVGADYQHFIDVYNLIAARGMGSTYTEIGYSFINFILASLGLNAQWIYIATSAFLGLAVRYFIVRVIPDRYWCFALFFFVTYGFFFSSMNLARQYFSLSFCLVALVKYGDGKHVSFWLLLLCAVSIHTSALFVALIPVVACLIRGKKGKGVMIVLHAVSLLFIFIDIRDLITIIVPMMGRWSHYSNADSFQEKNASAALKLIVPNLLLAWMYVSQRGRTLSATAQESGLSERAGSMILAGAMLYVVTQNMFSGVMVLTRISELYCMCYIGFLIMIAKTARSREEKPVLLSLYSAYGVLLTAVTVFMMNGSGVMPYESILTAPEVASR